MLNLGSYLGTGTALPDKGIRIAKFKLNLVPVPGMYCRTGMYPWLEVSNLNSTGRLPLLVSGYLHGTFQFIPGKAGYLGTGYRRCGRYPDMDLYNALRIGCIRIRKCEVGMNQVI
eukprot:SAG31_NODE_15482_length_753_cov_0.784404_2_plen_115_part_00